MAPSASLLTLILAAAAVLAEEFECPVERQPELHEEARLHRDLFCAYSFYDLRPVKDHKNTINVQVRFVVKYISFDYLEETFSVHSWLVLEWKDDFLNWDPTLYGGLKEIQVESSKFWTPRLALLNADATMANSNDIDTTCTVMSNGTVICVPHLIHSGICRTHLRKWPYDNQNCTLYFGSWMHTGEQINFTFPNIRSPVLLDDFQNGPGWNLMKVEHLRFEHKFGKTSYPMLQYTFLLRRVAAGPAATVVVPSIVIILLTLISLLLDVKNNVRLLVISFSLYAHFMFLTEIGYNIPKHSADTPIILLFLRDSMVITLVGICETLLLMGLRRRVEPAPTWLVSVNRLVSSGPGKYVVFTEFDPSDADAEGAAVKVVTDEGNHLDVGEESPRASLDWIQFANILNSAIFIVAAFTYVVLIFTYIPYGSVILEDSVIINS